MGSQVRPIGSVELTARDLEAPEETDNAPEQAQKSLRNLQCNTTSARSKALFQMLVFFVTNFLVASQAAFQFKPASIEVHVDDLIDGSPHDQNFLLGYNSPVFLPQDDLHPSGWNLQDIMDLPRAMDSGDEYRDPETQARMIQNYEICKRDCLTEDGDPRDMYDLSGHPTRDFDIEPYGEMDRDYYVNRDTFLEFADFGFYHSFLSHNGSGDPHKDMYGLYGIGSIDSNINNTSPTSSSYLCNLGTQRTKVTAIRIRTQGCHVQIASTEGNKYRLFVKQRHRKGLTAAVRKLVVSDHTSGCRTQEILLEAVNPTCRRVQVPGTEEACERECSVVLFKGHTARRLPIIVEPMANLTSPIPTLRIDDQYLVLDSMDPSNEFDLSISGGSMNVELSRARIKNLDTNLKYGTVHLDHLRNDYSKISIEADDVALEDERNYELQYRSAANLVCQAAPLVEEIPKEFLSCDMQPTNAPEEHAHSFYDDKLDGYIDMAEFLSGIDRLGLTNGSDSLNLNEIEFQRLMDHVFSTSQPDAGVQQLPYELFEEQLNKVMPPFTTLYDSTIKQECLNACGNGTSTTECIESCLWYCGHGGINITEPIFGRCDVFQGCVPSCGSPDTPITGNRVQTLGGVNYHTFDVDPPDGVITIEEMRQALLKLYGNCTYYIEPNEKDYVTCEYIGPGQYDLGQEHNRRLCKRYSLDDRIAAGQIPYDYNELNWRIENSGLPSGTNETLLIYGQQPRECRPFPDYDPKLNGKQFDATVTANQCPECFLPDGTRVPEHYYNRSTWSPENYDAVMNHLKRIFTVDLVGNSFAYFNISDDDQFRHFAAKTFTRTVVEQKVSYETFNANLQTLSSVSTIGSNYYLFNPWCYRGTFLKIGPGDYSSNDTQTILESSAMSFLGSTANVEKSNMPGYKSKSASGSVGINPCPPDWGNGTQGSTMFSYFPWTDDTVGRKWGKRLPVWCLDEAWPSGGIAGVYGNDVLKYGSMAGKNIPPGCEPISCKPLMHADVVQGSIHAQVLPFTFDPYNISGSYLNMITHCQSSDGSSRCFFKGYDAHMEEHFRKTDEEKLEHIKNVWVDESAADESVVMIDVSGFGVPSFKKWFWTSRQVYMQLEPAYLDVFSLGVLNPRLVVADLRMTPGMCNQEHGAVPKIDWRDNATYGGTTGLRMDRERMMEDVLRRKIQPDDQAILRGAFYLKQVWRKPYKKEDLMFDSTTYNPLTDTEPGFIDSSGVLMGKGPFFRHQRACSSSEPCNQVFEIYRDNCLVERTLSYNSATGGYELSPCQDDNGAPAYLDPVMQEAGLTFNETAYFHQFPGPLDQYSWDEVSRMSGGDIVLRNHYVHLIHHSHANATSYFFDKIVVKAGDSGEVDFVSVHNEILQNVALVLSLVLSAAIAGIIGLGLLSVILLLALKALGRYRAKKRNLKKIDNAKRQDRINALLEMVSVDHRRMMRAAAKAAGRDSSALLEEELNLPDVKRQALLDFALKEWNEDKDVSEWDLEAMKAEWDRYEETMPEGGEAENGKSVKVNVDGKNSAGSLLSMSSRGIKAFKKDEEVEEAKGLLNSTINKTALLQAKVDELAQKKSRIGQIILFLRVRARQLKKLVEMMFQADVPSPFDVIDTVIIDQFRRRLINSLRTFIKEKCIQDQAFTDEFEVRLGGTLDDLSEYEEGKTVARLGLATDVGVAKTIFGKVLRYKVAWVRVWCEKKQVSMDGVTAEMSVIHIHEGPRLYTNASTSLPNWEEGIGSPNPALGEERYFTLPGPESSSGGVKHNYVVTAEWGTRTVQVSTEGSIYLKELGPTVQFKTVLRNFNPAYEKFCMNWGLIQKNVLNCEGTLKSLNIHITKRIVTSLKGLRLKTDEDRAKEKLRASRTTEHFEGGNLNADESDEQGGRIKGDAGRMASEANDAIPSAASGIRWGKDLAGCSTIDETIYVNTERGLFSSGMKTGMIQASLSCAGWEKLVSEGLSLERALSISSSTQRQDEVDEDEESLDQSHELLESKTIMAKFLRSQYVVTGNFTRNVEEYDVFKARYRLWCKRMQIHPEILDTEEFLTYGVIYSEEAFYDVFGATVNERDLNVNPMGSNQHVWYLMRVLSVWLHLFFVWLPVFPLVHVSLYHQKLYSRTTAIQPQLTLDDLRSNPDDFGDYAITTINGIVLGICVAWLILCHVKLLVFYIGIAVPYFRKAYLRAILKGVFWLFSCLVLSMVISYILFVFTWLILGAVIRPQAFLPYCTAVVTFFAHAKSTFTRLMDAFESYKVRIAAIVGAAFAAKIIASLAMKKKAKSQGSETKTEEPATMEPYPVFQMYAGEDDNLNYEEFGALLDCFNIEMIEDKRRMFFAKVDADGSGEIGYVEFEKAWKQIQRDIVRTRMQEAGITKGRVACLFLYSISILLLVFAFIFVGVTAFVGEGAFGAVINSALTAGSGVAMNSGKENQEDEDEELGIEKAEEDDEDE